MRTALARFALATIVAGCGVATAQPPGFDPAAFADMSIKRYDTDGDGKISRTEAAASSRMAGSFDESDTNRDGFVTADEMKTRIAAKMAEGGGWRGRSSPTPTPATPAPVEATNTVVVTSSPTPDNSRSDRDRSRTETSSKSGKKVEDEKKPFVARYGNLPKEAPSWFHDLDGDQDGMIGLYEWRRDKRAITEFVAMDLNGDGYLTADEYVRHKQAEIDTKPETKTTALARLRGEPVGRAPAVEVRAERPESAERPSTGGTERASTGDERKRGQRREGSSKRNPFQSR